MKFKIKEVFKGIKDLNLSLWLKIEKKFKILKKIDKLNYETPISSIINNNE
jgi:hypothetical protein